MTIDTSFLKKDISLLKQLGITLLMMTLTRFVFLFTNFSAFSNIVFIDFLGGIWMDAITIGIYFIPFYGLSLLPVPFYSTKWYQTLLKTLFHIINSVIIAINLIDVEYYKYTAKRSTADLYSMVAEGNDMGQLAGTFLADFWWIILIFIVLVTLSNYLYNKTIVKEKLPYKWHTQVLNFILMGAILFIIGRGGFGYRPADMLTAAQFTSPNKVALVTNTPLSIIKTVGKAPLQLKNYFPEGDKMIYSPIHKGNNSHQLRDDVNIMVIILESFGDEWLGVKTGGNFTPFLDSLLGHSLYFDNAFANGKKSIEAVPSIFAGIPSLMDNPYVSSNYGTNNIKALPQYLKEQGYSSAFYHGATNGSMKFDVFTAHLGFEKYFGRTEFNNEDQCDVAWGALDEYFLPWTAKSITEELKEPFLAGLFTLSSHHPYYIPPEHENVLPEGDHPIAKSIAYTDMSLRLFFEEAKKQPWYDNTIFIITSDHTPAGHSMRYRQRIGMYQIPIAIYDPQQEIKPEVNSQIFSHIDIFPTVLDLTGNENNVYTFGNSYFSSRAPFSINYIENSYLFFKGYYMINMIDDQITGLYNYKEDHYMTYDSLSFYPDLGKEMENNLKGFVQRYNHDLIKNLMRLE